MESLVNQSLKAELIKTKTTQSCMGQLRYQCEEYSVHFNYFERACCLQEKGLGVGGN